MSKFDDIIADARVIVQMRETLAPFLAKFATAVLDLLAEAQPCGYSVPTLSTAGDGQRCVVVPDWSGSVDPDDARAMARMLIAAADEAEAKS